MISTRPTVRTVGRACFFPRPSFPKKLASVPLSELHSSNPAFSKPTSRAARDRARLRGLLYLVCVCTDFCAFIVMFTVSRRLAEAGAEPHYLGILGAGVSFSAAIASLLGGWLSQRFDGRGVFLGGTATLLASIAACSQLDPKGSGFVAAYASLGFGLGCLYPPLIGWLNRGEADAHTNSAGVSRRLILFCVAWNLGMMAGQLTGGSLFSFGADVAFLVAFRVAVVNFILASVAASQVARLEREPVAATVAHLANQERAAVFKRLGWFANLGGMFGGSMVVHLLSDLAVAIDVTSDQQGKLMAGWRVIIIATYLVMHVSQFWHYRLSAALTSQALGAVGLVVIASANSGTVLMLGLALLGQLVGFNYFAGLYYSTAGSSTERRALAAGIHEATLAGGMAVGTIVGGLMGTWMGHRVPYYMAAGVVALMMSFQVVGWWMGGGRRDRSAERSSAD